MKVNQSTNQSQEAAANNQTKKADRSAKLAAANEAKGKKSATAHTLTSDDLKADISERAKEFAKAKGVATAAPDIREEKIAALKKKIQEGSYKIDADAVADKMVDEHIKTSRS